MKFNEKITRLRKIKGITQDEFANAVGVSRQSVYKWESGQSYPEVPKLLEIKIIFDISLDDLLDDNYEIPLPEKKRRKRTVITQKAAEIEQKEQKEEKEAQITQNEPIRVAKTEEYGSASIAASDASFISLSADDVPLKEAEKTEEAYVTDEKTEEKTEEIRRAKEEAKEEKEEKRRGFFGRLFGRK